MDTLFTLRNETLGQLDQTIAVTFFRELLWAESRKLNLPICNVSISLWTTVPDGGVDARIDNPTGIPLETSGLIRNGNTSFQIKTGNSFSPTAKAAIQNELFGKGKSVTKENLGESVKKCLDESGTYILVCFGKDLTPQERSKSVEIVKGFFTECGYSQFDADVWSQGTISGYAQSFPSLVLQFQDIGSVNFLTFERWKNQGDMNVNFVPGEAQKKFVLDVQTELRKNDKAQHIRITGEPGIGKTRLVLEALAQEDLKVLVIYCDFASAFKDSNLMTYVSDNTLALTVLLVIDECDTQSTAYIWNKLQHLGARIKLVTIYNENDTRSGTSAYFEVPPLDKVQISDIINGYGIGKDQSDRWGELCGGSPRFAHVIGWNLKTNQEDVLKPLDSVDVWERFITGSDLLGSPDVKQRVLVLRYLSLFKKFGFKTPVLDEAKAIHKIIFEADNSITWVKFNEIIGKLKRRKILQGEVTLYITPKALHIKLWRDWWDNYGDSFDPSDFFSKIPNTLLDWFYEMFKYAAESATASKVVATLLGEGGPFQHDDYLKTELGSSFFLALTEANPELALKCLQNVLGIMSKDELKSFTTGRRNVIESLERIAVIKDLFSGAAGLLLLLGEAENENYSNNASGIFSSLFSPGPDEVAPTQASPADRFPILKDALGSSSIEKINLALNACDAALETNHFTRFVGPEFHGLKKVPLWKPSGRAEIVEAYRRVWRLLNNMLDTLPSEQQKRGIAVLLGNARGLIGIPELTDEILADLSLIADKSIQYKKDVLKTVESTLHYGRKDLANLILEKLEILKNKLIGEDFPSLLQRYVGMELLEDHFDADGKRADKVEEPLNKLVAQSLVDLNKLDPEYSWLFTNDAKNGYRFGYKLGLGNTDFTLLPKLLLELEKLADSDQTSDYFFGGYLKAVFEKDPSLWESTLDKMANNKKLVGWVSPITWRSGMSDIAAMRILGIAKQKLITVGSFRIFGYGSVIQNLSESVLRQWIEFLLQSDEEVAISIVLDLFQFFYIGKDRNYTLPRELTLNILTHHSLFSETKTRRDQMDDFHWTEIGKKFLETYPQDGIKLAEIILESFGKDGTILEGYHNEAELIINAIFDSNPAEVWAIIVKYLGPPLDVRAYHIKEWLRGGGMFEEVEGSITALKPELVWSWVEDDVNTRARYLATFVPKVFFNDPNRMCWARELLIRYGKIQDVRNNLVSNFFSEGWTGPASLHYQQRRDGLASSLTQETNENVKKWLTEFISILDKYIEREKIAEERRGF